ncbi:uncharacterized protein AKAW2_70855A [Aspergillus luchuensis]|uniref:Uncharacterized protein n=1 Tax=Aspergillus kawachii TaxID=1069201 RepID=A0A7R7WJ62_ASPKA|nr:uncharacterized protein AKAW2_70855A [Aspergillus luchuensis]BCS03977.1 hypothetical protein AKAW2_70855A [Aspergillus luchuensis]BCS15584.1 hypothetical protein ALUC_70817A [Aspergillus luchuensis]
MQACLSPTRRWAASRRQPRDDDEVVTLKERVRRTEYNKKQTSGIRGWMDGSLLTKEFLPIRFSAIHSARWLFLHASRDKQRPPKQAAWPYHHTTTSSSSTILLGSFESLMVADTLFV